MTAVECQHDGLAGKVFETHGITFGILKNDGGRFFQGQRLFSWFRHLVGNPEDIAEEQGCDGDGGNGSEQVGGLSEPAGGAPSLHQSEKADAQPEECHRQIDPRKITEERVAGENEKVADKAGEGDEESDPECVSREKCHLPEDTVQRAARLPEFALFRFFGGMLEGSPDPAEGNREVDEEGSERERSFSEILGRIDGGNKSIPACPFSQWLPDCLGSVCRESIFAQKHEPQCSLEGAIPPMRRPAFSYSGSRSAFSCSRVPVPPSKSKRFEDR